MENSEMGEYTHEDENPTKTAKENALDALQRGDDPKEVIVRLLSDLGRKPAHALLAGAVLGDPEFDVRKVEEFIEGFRE